MKWCKLCVLPDTRPNLIIDNGGICNACKLHKTKKKIDWDNRRKNFELIINTVKKLIWL